MNEEQLTQLEITIIELKTKVFLLTKRYRKLLYYYEKKSKNKTLTWKNPYYCRE